MRVFLSIFLLLFIVISGRSQTFSDSLQKEISQYNEAIENTEDSCLQRVYLERLSDNYRLTGNRTMAKESLRKAIESKCYKGKVGREMRSWRLGNLGDMWFEDKNYDSALYYYKRSNPNNRNYGIGSANYFIKTAYQIFLCYKQKRQIDSAFICFTPFALDSTLYSEDSIYEQMVNDYYDLLLSKYSRKKIISSFVKGCKELDFGFITKKDTAYDGKEYYAVRPKAIFKFLGDEFDLNGNSGSMYVMDTDRDLQKQFPGLSKEYYLEQLMASYLFKLISTERL